MDKNQTRKSHTVSKSSKHKYGIEKFRSDANNGKLTVRKLEYVRVRLGIPVADYIVFLKGSDNLDLQIIKALEDEYAAIKSEMQAQDKKLSRGGLRPRAGRKSEGNVSKLVRITGTPEEMKSIVRWMNQAPRASRRLVSLILRDISVTISKIK